MTLPRGICKVCGQEVAVNKDGTMRGHGYRKFDYQWCRGSGLKGWKERPQPDYSEAT